MNLELYRNNTTLKQALGGYIPRICEAARRDGIVISPNTLRRHCQQFKEECGASFWAKTLAIVHYLGRFNRARVALLEREWFAVLPDRVKKLWKRDEWLESVFERIGKLQALAIRGRWNLIQVERFELAELLRAEIV